MEESALARGGFLVRKVFEALMEHPEGLAAESILRELEARFDLSDIDPNDPNGLTVPTMSELMPFQSLGPVRARWLSDESGRWSLTQEGRSAYWNFPDPREFMREAIRGESDVSEVADGPTREMRHVREIKPNDRETYSPPYWLTPQNSPTPETAESTKPAANGETETDAAKFEPKRLEPWEGFSSAETPESRLFEIEEVVEDDVSPLSPTPLPC